jgi:hypothetical protein
MKSGSHLMINLKFRNWLSLFYEHRRFDRPVLDKKSHN